MSEILSNYLNQTAAICGQLAMPGTLSGEFPDTPEVIAKIKVEREALLKRDKAAAQLRAVAKLAEALLLARGSTFFQMEYPDEVRSDIRRAFEIAALIVDEGKEWTKEQYPELNL